MVIYLKPQIVFYDFFSSLPLDLSQLEGAVGYTAPSTDGELIPEMDIEPEETNRQEIRRRRLQKLTAEIEETQRCVLEVFRCRCRWKIHNCFKKKTFL